MSSSPMVGMAHKIELSPAALNFFALVEGPAIQQTLTITNQGVTTPSLTVTTNKPFSVNASLFALAAGESKDVTVQFSPPASGEFSSTISIKTGQMQAAFTIPVKGNGITEAEFLQWLSEMSQTGPIDAVITTETVDVGLLNFRNLTPADFQSLINLAETEGWDSLLPTGVEPEQWWLRLVQLVYQFLTRDNSTAKQSVLSSLGTLANVLKNRGEAVFNGIYEGLKNDSAFKPFLDVLKEIINDLGVSSLFAPGLTADAAVKQAIEEFCKIYSNDSYDRDGLNMIFLHFGPAAVFAVAAAAKIDPNVAAGTGVTGNIINGSAVIAVTQTGWLWYKIDNNNKLWSQLVTALLTLGEDAAKLNTRDNQWRFNSTITALGVTATMAYNGWGIHAFRAQAGGTTIDVVGSANISGRQVVVFGQFFHAVTEFDQNQLGLLLGRVQQLAGGIATGLQFLWEAVGGGASFDSINDNRNLFGVVIAVKQADLGRAEQTVDEIMGPANYCSGRCFAIIIAVDDNKIITDIVIKGNIDEALAKEILTQMGFVKGKKMPDSPHMRLMMRFLMMALGMIP